jgi:uncharacterized membrane protein
MNLPTVIWGAANWLIPAAAIVGLLVLLVLWGYTGTTAPPRARWLAAGLKLLGVLILALCLLEPLLSSTRAKPGANQFVILSDNSQSMTLTDRDASTSRGAQLKSLLARSSRWLQQVAQDFDLRQYSFDNQLAPLADAEALTLDGSASNLGSSLQRLIGRYQGRPLAGVMLLTDGNPTDAEAVERVISQAAASNGSTKLPPIYPVLIGGKDPAADINLDDVSVTQTNFEDAPVTLAAQIQTSGYKGRTIVAELTDQSGASLEQQKLTVEQDGQPLVARFRLKPLEVGVSFYQIKVAADPSQLRPVDQPASNGDEATLANNSRLVAVDRGQGPYRVLYVSGRPNWEFKFLNRAVMGDSQTQLVGMIRIAKREPKFSYLGHLGEQSNPLFRGFDGADPNAVEQYDQPVLIRIGTLDSEELRSGFPQTAADLYRYHAIILDDIESEFFTQDQMLLIKEFVRYRGGGFLMLGGQESFKNGKYDRTPIGDLLPVYVDQVSPSPDVPMRMALTREGWLEPWVRLRPEEATEQQRLSSMPPFQTINTVRGIKPGATILARAQVQGGEELPALVEQRFGKGRTAALLIGDLWRWDLHRPDNSSSDLEKAWRQTIRWLVADVPKRVEVAVEQPKDESEIDGATRLDVRVRDIEFAPLDNASVTVRIATPDGKSVELTAEASAREAGLYEAVYVPRQSGAYRAEIIAMAPDGSEAGRGEAGWTSEPAADEFRVLTPNRDLLERLARATGGQTVEASQLDSFAATLPTRHVQITEPYIRPLWHTPWVFLLAIACLTAEWGIRRWKGLP